MAGENVGVKLGLTDNVSPQLRNISKLMDKVIVSMDRFSMSALIATNNTSKLADNLERMAKSYSEIKSYGRMKLPSVSEGRGSTSSNPALRGMKIDSGYGADALRGSASDIKNLMSRIQELPKGLEYNFIGLSERINRVVNDLKLAYATGEQFTGVLRKMNIPNAGAGLSSAMIQAQSSFKRQLSSIKAMQENFTRDGVLSVEELTSAYKGLSTVLKDAKNVHMQMTNVMNSGKLSSEQVQELNAEYQKYINNVKAVTQAVTYLGDATDKALDSPELRQAVKDFEKAEKEARDLAETEARLKKEASSTASSTRTLNNELSRTSTVSSSAKSGISSLTTSLKGLVASFISVYSAQKLIETSDSLILSEGKLSNLTDNVNGLKNSIYQMSQDTRTSYLDNMSQMAKMWQLTGGSSGIFDTEDKLLQFNEVLNKAFTLGGSGTREINASLYQLTQALSSGRLQGDELRSLAENAPYLINSVIDSLEAMYNKGKDQSEWIELTYKDLKDLGAEGVLTSDLIVGAVLDSTDKVRKAYENLTPTFEQIFQTIKNQAIKISEPILKKLNEIFNSEAFEKTAQVLMKMVAMLVAALTPIADIILWIGEVMADNWGIVEPILWGIIGALGVYYGSLMLIKGATIAVGIVTKGFAVIQGIFKGIASMAILAGVATGKYTLAQGKAAIVSMFHLQAKVADIRATKEKIKTDVGATLTTANNTKVLWGNTIATGASAGAATGASIATGAFASAVQWLNTVLLANPITWVVLGVVALIAVIYLAVKAWNYFTDDTLTMLGAVAAGVAWLGGTIANIFIGIYNIGITSLRYLASGFVALGAVAHNIVMGIWNIFVKAAGVIAGTFMALWATIQNTGIGMWNGLVEVAEGITNAFIGMKNVLNNIFVTLFGWIIDGINGIIGGLNKLVDGYNAVATTLGGSAIDHFGTIETTMEIVPVDEGFVDFSEYKGEYKDISGEFNKGLHMFDGYIQEYDDVGQAFNNTFDSLASLEDWKVDYVDPNEWASSARKWGDDSTDWLKDKWNNLLGDMDYTKYMDGLDANTEDMLDDLEALNKTAEDAIDGKDPVKNYKGSLPKGGGGSSLGGSGLTPDQEAALGNISGNTDDIADSVSVTDEQLKLLRELAERRAINRFTTAEISITNNMSNTINSEMDMDGVVNYLTNELNKSLVAGAESANHY